MNYVISKVKNFNKETEETVFIGNVIQCGECLKNILRTILEIAPKNLIDYALNYDKDIESYRNFLSYQTSEGNIETLSLEKDI